MYEHISEQTYAQLKKKTRIMSGTNVRERLLYGDEISAEWREGVRDLKVWGRVFQVQGSPIAKCPHTRLILACLGPERQ